LALPADRHGPVSLHQLRSVEPYLGAGVNFTYYLDNTTRNDVAGTSMHINPSWGPAGRVGFDYMIDRHWGINVDTKWIYSEPNWRDNVGPFDTLTGNAHVNPFLVGAGITYRFGGLDFGTGVVARY